MSKDRFRKKIHDRLIERANVNSDLSNIDSEMLGTIFRSYDILFFRGEITERIEELNSEIELSFG